jgi:phosphoglycerate dehydrogenase-like enzyme
MKIYIDTPFEPVHKALLRSGITGDELIFKDELATSMEQQKALYEADILLGNPKPVELLEKAVNLKWIQLYSTGFEYYSHIRLPAIVTNMQDYYAQPCAETMIAGILAIYRSMDKFTLLKDWKQWVGYRMRAGVQLLNGKKVIILGWGHIGKRLAHILSGFDCPIQVFARTAAEAQLRTPQQLEQAIPDADIIIACLPGTKETAGLFTVKMIELMKETALFCNVGRGNLLEDEHALVNALMQGKLGGAVLDVTAEEPIPADHPLWDCPNTMLSQHSGGGNLTEYQGIAELFMENLQAFKANRPLKNRIDLSKGY